MPVSIDVLREPYLAVDEAFAVPEALNPAHATEMLPAAGAEDLATLARAGWARLGIVAAIIDEQERVLILDHYPNDKITNGSLGPLAETTHFSRDQGAVHIESASHTLARGIREELGVSDPDILGLTAITRGAWTINTWPVGGRYEQQYALAVCPVTHINRQGREALLDTFAPTDEIRAVRFMSRDDITLERNLRPGTQVWLGDVVASNLLWTPDNTRGPVALPTGTIPGVGQDVRFDKIPL